MTSKDYEWEWLSKLLTNKDDMKTFHSVLYRTLNEHEKSPESPDSFPIAFIKR